MEIEEIDVIKTNKENEKADNEWINKELEQIKESSFDGERLESFKPIENKTTLLEIDITEPWKKWEDPKDNTIKKIIPIKHEGSKKVFWVNVKNPIYRKLLELAAKATKENKTSFPVKILRTGQMQNTRYVVVD